MWCCFSLYVYNLLVFLNSTLYAVVIYKSLLVYWYNINRHINTII